ncbi:MAG: DUF1269 domain-containing protein [Geminicoccaceae bacterium]|nr:DUF1269 domain-containing protein [Geminicoccaceae bacterium]MCB9944036.1 DUF1269 domain-containing protein [Geminicoccaceae bacterium]
MSNLIAITFEDQAYAFELRADLIRMQKEYLIEMDDAVVVTRDQDGKVKLHQAVNLTAMGAVGGSWWGLLVGLLFLNPIAGVAVGAGAGALAGALSDVGIDDDFMKKVGESLNPGGGAVFVLVRKVTGDKVLAGLERYRSLGKVYTTSLSHDQEQKLRDLFEDHHAAKAGSTVTS